MRNFRDKTFACIPAFKSNQSQSNTTSSIQTKLTQLQQTKSLVGFAGRFVEEKGFDILLKAIPIVRQQYPNAHFVFAGEVNVHYESFYQQLLPEISAQAQSISMLGLLNQEKLSEFYRALSVFVLCSRSECFALTQIEAALHGVPLVVSNIPGARTLVQETGCGTLVTTEDPEALADGICLVLRNQDSFQLGLSRVRNFLSKYEAFPIN